jgi:hypothetical protein
MSAVQVTPQSFYEKAKHNANLFTQFATTKMQSANQAYQEWRVANPKAAMVSDVVAAAAVAALGAYIGFIGTDGYSAMSKAVETFGGMIWGFSAVFGVIRTWHLAKDLALPARSLGVPTV